MDSINSLFRVRDPGSETRNHYQLIVEIKVKFDSCTALHFINKKSLVASVCATLWCEQSARHPPVQADVVARQAAATSRRSQLQDAPAGRRRTKPEPDGCRRPSITITPAILLMGEPWAVGPNVHGLLGPSALIGFFVNWTIRCFCGQWIVRILLKVAETPLILHYRFNILN